MSQEPKTVTSAIRPGIFTERCPFCGSSAVPGDYLVMREPDLRWLQFQHAEQNRSCDRPPGWTGFRDARTGTKLP